MKPPVAPSGWMEVLDKEEGWTWGRTNPGFDSNVAQYLLAINELGRPIDAREKTGRYKATYRFWHSMRSTERFSQLSPVRKATLQNLPYFSLSPIEATARRLMDEIVEFKHRFGRLPRARVLKERSLNQKHLYLRLMVSHNVLTKHLRDEIKGHDLLKTHRNIIATSYLDAIKVFVKQHKRWPSQHGHSMTERKLYSAIKSYIDRHRKGRPATLPLKDILDVPCCPYKVAPIRKEITNDRLTNQNQTTRVC